MEYCASTKWLVSVQGAFIKGSAGPGAFGRMSQASEDPRNKSEINYIAGGQQTWQNPAGRVSVQFAPGAVSPPPPHTNSLAFLTSYLGRVQHSLLDLYPRACNAFGT